jgi:twitching motility protein PilT
MTGMLRELLPEDSRRVLDEVGAVQHDLSNPTIADGERFTVVAARGGDDIWIEIRRHRRPAPVAEPAPDPVMELLVEPPQELTPELVSEAIANDARVPAPVLESEPASDITPAAISEAPEPTVAWTPEPTVEWTAEPTAAWTPEPASEWAPEATNAWTPEVPNTSTLEATGAWTPELTNASAAEPPIPVSEPQDQPAVHFGQHEWKASSIELVQPESDELAEDVDPNVHEVSLQHPQEPDTPQLHRAEAAQSEPLAWNPPTPAHETRVEVSTETEREPMSAVVVPLARSQSREYLREKPTIRFVHPQHTSGIDRLLRVAAARGASTLYLTSQARPSIRVNGEITPMDGEPVFSESDVEALMLEIVPETHRDALRSEAGTEWVCDVPDVGRLRCVTFRDHRGAGGIFRMIPARAISAEQLGLSPDIQALCDEANGLVLVAGPRSSGKSTLIAAFVDLINRTRSDHVVTLEQQITFVHENRGSLVSQREVRGGNSEWLSAARAALRENPDVLVIEEMRSPEIVALALEAAQSGHLVIGAVTAHTSTAAIDGVLHQTPADRRSGTQVALAETLRGVVAQVLLRKTGGGRIAARELLLNTPAVTSLIAEGKTAQLPAAIESGRRHGMVALNDVLVAFVQSGVIDSREAYRQAADQQGFLALLQRQGIDTSFVERLA